MLLKALQMFVDVSDEQYVSILSQYVFMKYSQIGFDKIHQIFGIFL
jgi:hypothetical protein